MAYTPDFDWNKMLGSLNSLIEAHAEGSKEREAAELAQIALLYIRHIGRKDEFSEYYRACFNTSFKVEISHEFSTREEADKWLASGKASPGERVKIAGKGALVVQLPGRLTVIDAPLPEELG